MKSGKGVELPRDLVAALEADAEALRVFEQMRPSCQREYAQWVTEAKKDATRTRRVAGVLTRIREYGARHSLLDADAKGVS